MKFKVGEFVKVRPGAEISTHSEYFNLSGIHRVKAVTLHTLSLEGLPLSYSKDRFDRVKAIGLTKVERLIYGI